MNLSRILALVLVGAAALSPSAAFAEQEPAVDVKLQEAPRPRRFLAVELNPVAALVIGKLSANVILVPLDHHALIVSPFYGFSNTADIWVIDDNGNQTRLAQQKFRGFGAEIGYRYYSQEGGPRGFFIGPSAIVSSFTATAGDGTQTSYLDLGVAADVGYQMLVADNVSISLGAGAEYVFTTKTLPNQQFPARIYANNGVLPRALLSIGWAF